LAGLCVALLSSSATAQDAWGLLKKPGHIVLLRHAYAPGILEEPAGIDLKNCKLQRNLDETGRIQARRIGDGFRKHGRKRVRLLSSQFCRNLETARLMALGPVEPRSILNFVNFVDKVRLEDVVQGTIKLMKTIPPRQLAVLVTHISNVKALTAVTPSSGEMVIVRFDSSGELVVAGRVSPP
jgi:phosphohistidine phosphatase SixA